MMDTLIVVIATGLSLGLVFGYRAGRAVMRIVGGPFAGRPLILSLVAAGGVLFLIPATMFVVLGTRNLEMEPGSALGSGSPLAMAGVALGIALIIGSGLVVAVFASSVCGRFIEEMRSGRRQAEEE